MSERPLSVVQFTDTHLYAQEDGALLGINTRHSLDAVLELARARPSWPPDLVLATGDLTHDATPEAYGRFVEQLGGLGAPAYCLPGNHDESIALRTHLNTPPIHATAHLQSGRWQFCFLDTTVPGSEGGHLSAEELDALDRNLTAHPDHHALVCLHHQPLPVGSAWLDTMTVDNGGQLFDVIDRHPRVRGVLWGHVHQEYDRMHRDVRLLASPSTCIQFAPGSEEFAIDEIPPGYRWLQLHGDGRIETGVERLAEMPGTLDLGAEGY